MSFTVFPTSVAPLGPLAASGTGPRKVLHRIIVRENDPETPGHVLTTFTMPANQRFSNRMMVAPGGSARRVTLELQKFRPDKVWAQTASADVKLLLATSGDGGGTVPGEPNDPPPPTPDVVPPVISDFVIDQVTTTSFRVRCTLSEPGTFRVKFGIDSVNEAATTLDATLTTSKSVVLTGLTPNLAYKVQIATADAAGNPALSAIRQVSTLAVTPPAPGPEPPGTVVDVSNTAEFEAQVYNLNVSEIVLNPGTYQPDSEVAPDYFLPPVRTADNPLLIRAQNVPAVATDPFDVIWKSRIYLRNRRGSYVTWKGISFEEISVGTTGIVTFGAYGEPGPDHFAFETIRFVDNIPLNASNSHHWYLSSGSSSYGIINGFFVEGVDRNGFTGFHAYHEDLGHHIEVKNGVIRKVYAGLLMYGTAGASPPKLTDFLAEDIDIQDARTGVDIRYVQGILRRVAQANVGPGSSYIKGPIVLDDCPTLPVPVP